MKITISNKGGYKIVWSGYSYVVKHMGRKRITWRCARESSMKCYGSMYTDLNKCNPQNGKVHNHRADKHEVNTYLEL